MSSLGADNDGMCHEPRCGRRGFSSCPKADRGRNNTILTLHRLRGSGLDANLIGELVWLGATKKEAGIRFQEIPSEVRQGIADWIVRETRGSEAPPTVERFRPKPMPAMTGTSATGSKTVPLPLSTALAMSRELTVEPPPVAAVDMPAAEPIAPVPQDLPSGISAAPPPEIVSPIERTTISSGPPEGGSLNQPVDSDVSSLQDQNSKLPAAKQGFFLQSIPWGAAARIRNTEPLPPGPLSSCEPCFTEGGAACFPRN